MFCALSLSWLCFAAIQLCTASIVLDRQTLPERAIIDLDKRDSANPRIYSHVYALGDSLSDNGNYQGNGPPYWQKRASNGPVMVEQLAAMLNATLVDKAWAGAVIDKNYLYGSTSVPDTNTQIANFIAQPRPAMAPGKPRDLATIWVGTNNLISIFNGYNQIKGYTAQNAMDAVDENVRRLAGQIMRLRQFDKNGTIDFAIFNVGPLDLFPLLTQQARPSLVSQIFGLVQGQKAPRPDSLQLMQNMTMEFSKYLFNNLPAYLQNSGYPTRISLIDTRSFFTKVMTNPTSYGFTNGKDACYNSQTGLVCSDPDSYTNWDLLVHPTSKMHGLFASYVYSQLPSKYIST